MIIITNDNQSGHGLSPADFRCAPWINEKSSIAGHCRIWPGDGLGLAAATRTLGGRRARTLGGGVQRAAAAVLGVGCWMEKWW